MHRDLLTETRDFRASAYGGFAVLSVAGEVDISKVDDFRDHLHALMGGNPPRLVVDLSMVGFMDSAGLSVLIGGLRDVRRRGGTLRVVATSNQLVELFRVTGVHKALPPYATVAAAAEA